MRGFARKIKTVVKRVLMRHDNRSAAHSLPPSSVVLQGTDNSFNLSNCQEASNESYTRNGPGAADNNSDSHGPGQGAGVTGKGIGNDTGSGSDEGTGNGIQKPA